MDKITLDRIKTAHVKLQLELNAIYAEICERLKGKSLCRFARVFATIEEQNDIYAQGRTKPGKIVSWAKGSESFHNYGLAVDILLIVDKDGNGSYESAVWDTKTDFDGDGVADWREVVEVFMKYGWQWGGNWNAPKTDAPHFQKTFGYSIKDLQALAAKHNTYKDLPL